MLHVNICQKGLCQAVTSSCFASVLIPHGNSLKVDTHASKPLLLHSYSNLNSRCVIEEKIQYDENDISGCCAENKSCDKSSQKSDLCVEIKFKGYVTERH